MNWKGSRADKFGVCRLTGTQGKFVKSHIIPRAFTKPEVAGEPLWQAGLGLPVTKRFDSWYDTRLCTKVGEDVLAQIDGAAIAELRRHKLVWSGWGESPSLGSEHIQIGDTPYGIRTLEGVNLRLLRTFFLSLLWRAAASDRFEFAEVTVPDEDLDRIRTLVLSGDPGPIDFYPVSLIQLSSRGPGHNLTPIVQTKHIPALEDSPAWSVDIIRFYFDGLIAHIHKHNSDDGRTLGLGSCVIGNSEVLSVTTVSFEVSFQAENMSNIIESALYTKEPEIETT